ncbi:glycosyltransferase family 2 protein [Cellulomonas sp. Leaf334]|uniref:glycosyltransferase family 2 protein n=1 Tax=Cellulomonas sp. Leaf334 TaxID=1736339 RepID=UPI00138F481B|nr:glycosyltransferase [Cellulomonas sp. Leaf334]
MRSQSRSAYQIVDALMRRDVVVRVVANSRSALDALDALGVRALTAGRNQGFGAAINQAARNVEHWDWLLVLNDDVVVEPAALDEIMAGLANEQASIVYVGGEPTRRLPDRRSAFLQTAMLSKVVARRTAPRVGEGTYSSFSAVLIARRAWDAVDGFDERMPFSYEDADFVRRAVAAGNGHARVASTAFRHTQSVSTGRHVDTVLPVSVASARVYLDTWCGHPWLNTLVLMGGLVARCLAAPVSKAPFRRHLVGIRRSFGAALRPALFVDRLPDYERVGL